MLSNKSFLWKCVHCRTKQEKLACTKRVACIIILCVILFLLTLGLIMGFSYAINSKVYNMTTGCLLIEPNDGDGNCNTTHITFYAHGDTAILFAWTTALMSIETVMAFLLMLLLETMKHRWEDFDARYAYLDDLPNVPTDKFDSISDSL